MVRPVVLVSAVGPIVVIGGRILYRLNPKMPDIVTEHLIGKLVERLLFKEEMHEKPVSLTVILISTKAAPIALRNWATNHRKSGYLR